MKSTLSHFLITMVLSALVGVAVWAIAQHYYSKKAAGEKLAYDRDVATVILDSMAVSKLAGIKATDPAVVTLCALTYTIGLKRVVPYVKVHAYEYNWIGLPISLAVITDEEAIRLNLSEKSIKLARDLNQVLRQHKKLFPNESYGGDKEMP